MTTQDTKENKLSSEEIDAHLENILNKLLQSEKNKEISQVFFETLKNLKPKSCETKTGWVSGKYISFSCKCEKNGNSTVIKEIVAGMKYKTEDLYFIFGLAPDTFHFNPKFILDEPEHFYFSFKLERSSQNG